MLVSSAHGGKRNIMTMGWHTVMEFTPSLVGCVIAGGNYSYDLIRRSRECVINLPTTALTEVVVGIGNTTGAEIDKFERFKLTGEKATRVRAPLIRECHANLECRLADDSLVDKYNFFIFEVLKAHVARVAQASKDTSLHGRRRFHDLRQDHQPPITIPTGDALAIAPRFRGRLRSRSQLRTRRCAERGRHGRATWRTDQAPLHNHAARDAVDVRNELAAQAHRVVLAVSLLLRRSLRGGRERQKRETIEDDKTRDQLQLTLRNPISHG